MAKISEPVVFQDLWKLMQTQTEGNGLREGIAYFVDLFHPRLYMRLKGIFREPVSIPLHDRKFPFPYNLAEAKKEWFEGKPTLALHAIGWAAFRQETQLTPRLQLLRSSKITNCYWVLTDCKPTVLKGRVVLPPG